MNLLSRMRGDDSGVTFVELLVGSTLMLTVMGMMGTAIVTASDSSRRVRTDHDLNEEARNAINRVARELRQAKQLVHVANPAGSGYSATAVTALSIKADFNGDGCSGNAPACSGTDNTNNPESLTYCFDPGASGSARTYLWLIPSEVTATPTSCQLPGALPILAGDVAGFRVEYRGNAYRHDLSPTDGITTWEELDAAPAPVGDGDGDINTSALTSVTSLVVHLSMAANGRTQDYTTQIDLRNKS